jgi:separase
MFTEHFIKSQLLVKFSSFERKHVCLLIDKSLHQIPWECLPTLRQQTITRMPSIHFLLAHLKTCAATINKQNAFYIVDPGCDFVHTREKIQSFFQSQKSWQGIIGVAPDESQYKKALTEYQLFM